MRGKLATWTLTVKTRCQDVLCHSSLKVNPRCGYSVQILSGYAVHRDGQSPAEGRNQEATRPNDIRDFGCPSWLSKRALGNSEAPRLGAELQPVELRRNIVVPITNDNGFSSWSIYEVPETVLGGFIHDII